MIQRHTISCMATRGVTPPRKLNKRVRSYAERSAVRSAAQLTGENYQPHSRKERLLSFFRTAGVNLSRARSDHPPEPFHGLRDDVAEQQERRRPDQCGDEIGGLKAPVRHFENAGGERHGGAQGAEE